MATIVGVDLGSHSVKVAFSEGRSSGLEYRVRGVPQDGDLAPTLSERLEVLRALVSEIPELRDATATAAFPNEAASLRTVTLPFTDRGQVQKTLPFELEGHVPFDLDDFVLDYRVLRGGTDNSRVLCAMAGKTVLAELIAGLQEAGVEPRRMPLDAELLAAYASSQGHQMVVDLGHVRTLVAFVSQGEVVHARALSIGGRDLTLALCAQLECEWGVAEGEKHLASLAEPFSPVGKVEVEDVPESDQPTEDESDPNRVLSLALEPLISQLRATRLGFEAKQAIEVEELVVTGGTSELNGITELLATALGLPVRRALVSEEAQSQGDPGRFALCDALRSLAAGQSHGREFQFRRAEFGYKGDLVMVRNLAGYAAAGLVGVLAVGIFLFGLKVLDLSRQIRVVSSQIGEVVAEIHPEVPGEILDDSLMARDFLVEITASEVMRVDTLEGAMQGEPPTLALLRELSQAMPAPKDVRIEVREMTVTPASVQMQAQTTGYEAAATIEQSLQRNARFKAARKGDEKKVGDGIRFTVTIPLDGSEGEEG
jgi:general secretion pathway protein L